MKKLLRPRNLLFVCILILIVGILSGCSGTLYTVDEKGVEQKGVQVYPLKIFLEAYKTTAHINDDDQLIADEKGKYGEKCIPQRGEKIVIRPDYSKSHRIYYESGFLESNKFGVTLKDGALVALNTESQPDRGATVKNLGEAATEFAKLQAFAPEEDEPEEDDKPKLLACNATPILIGIFELPETKPFSDIPAQ